jgi:rhodanese-related sulfurtransferase
MKLRLKSFILSISLACLIGSACSNNKNPGVAKEFQFTNMKAVEAAKMLKENPKAIVLDIRTPAEFNEGHIPGAVNIDYKADSFESELEKLDRDATYVMHCRSGRRSANSFETFSKLGFKNIVHMYDGILGWKQKLIK